jgi:hypothetical protein
MSIVSILGVVIIVAGAFLFIGNVTRIFPTFPLAGWATILVGGIVMRAERNA